ncbi:hypothetical protein IMZ48_42010 [Candidatus Bathyarchaeota archaeon]|nr:hypothetical protein [Candidatus Bathyarchaeota archaeon]
MEEDKRTGNSDVIENSLTGHKERREEKRVETYERERNEGNTYFFRRR